MDERIEIEIFQNDLIINGVSLIVRGQDSVRDVGRPEVNDRDSRLRRKVLRDKLRISLVDHDMHRPRQNDWRQDIHMHTVRD